MCARTAERFNFWESLWIWTRLHFAREAGYVSGDLCYYPRKRLSQLTAVTKSFYPSWDDKKYEALLHRFSLDETKRVCELSAGMKVKYQLAWRAVSRGEAPDSRRADLWLRPRVAR